MKTNEDPLFTLSIGEFMERIKIIVEDIVNRKQEVSVISKPDEAKDEHFSILQLCRFLGCTKATIHNYKKRGLPWFGIGKKILFKKSDVMNFLSRVSTLRNKIGQKGGNVESLNS